MNIKFAHKAAFIAKALSEIEAERKQLERDIESCGVRLKAGQWINLPAHSYSQIKAIMRADLDRRHAECVRLANQIGLVL